jgi:hypothetical protein
VKNLDFRILIGTALILLGGLMLLQRIGFFPGLLDVFWGVVFLAGAAFFLYRFASDPSAEWWAAIPGFALTGLAAEILVPPSLGNWHGLLFLGALGLGFFAVYASGRQRWWAIIPGGVLITLGIIAILTQKLGGQESGPFLFVGLGITFLLVAILAGMRWAYIPGIVLIVLAALVGTASATAFNLVWPLTLIVAGLLLIWQFLRKS